MSATLVADVWRLSLSPAAKLAALALAEAAGPSGRLATTDDLELARTMTGMSAVTWERACAILADLGVWNGDDREFTPRQAGRKRPTNALGVEIWAAYSAAYLDLYGTAPVRNASTNGQCAQIGARIGGEAPEVARWFVGHPDAYYVREAHSLRCLLRDCEKLRMQWATGRVATGREARETERIGALDRARAEAKAMIAGRAA